MLMRLFERLNDWLNVWEYCLVTRQRHDIKPRTWSAYPMAFRDLVRMKTLRLRGFIALTHAITRVHFGATVAMDIVHTIGTMLGVLRVHFACKWFGHKGDPCHRCAVSQSWERRVGIH